VTWRRTAVVIVPNVDATQRGPATQTEEAGRMGQRIEPKGWDETDNSLALLSWAVPSGLHCIRRIPQCGTDAPECGGRLMLPFGMFQHGRSARANEVALQRA
jgi:hypothetical protein